VDETSQPALAHEQPTASVFGRWRRRRSRRGARLGWAVAGLAALALVAAACSGGGSSGGGLYGTGSTALSRPPVGAVVGLRGSSLGQILVDGQGRTLYLFEADKAGTSRCQGPCASAWPPYLSNGTPRAGTGVAGSLLGTSMRSDGDGGTQVTYHGHPLYYYAGDSEAGDTAGQGLDQFGARWFVLARNGDKIGTP
jgi:predicted lipoprotein with Yx(FWY)xxD motif